MTSLFVVILSWVASSYLRSRDPLLRDVMWMFASVAMLFVVGLVRLFMGTPPRSLMIAALGFLLAKPLFSLRLASRLRPLPSWWWPVALSAWALSAFPVLVTAVRPMPRPVVWLAASVFFVLEGVAAGRLIAEARRRGGAARARLRCAAAGTGLFGTALLISATGNAVGSRVLAVGSGVLYLLAFVPP
ncbi:MAG: hybrid sensor histidine kinase/response regulator, partial [Actinoplanes sp.]